ncbi:MAG: hypothetical protein WC655_13535, partial [Candidatus Hydrogenedentales bacterium]
LAAAQERERRLREVLNGFMNKGNATEESETLNAMKNTPKGLPWTQPTVWTPHPDNPPKPFPETEVKP